LALPQVTQVNGTSRLLVYKLGGSLPAPENPPAAMALVEEPPALTASDDSLARGEDLYLENCMRCHGPLVGAGGVVQDLRYISSGTHQIFEQIVLGGIYEPLGMVSFADVLSEQDVQDVHSFVISAARDTWDQQHDADWWQSWKSWFYDQIGTLVAWVMSPA
jgi:quinohemoprotein ethanol dehydrogenase